MTNSTLFVAIIALALIAFAVLRQRSIASVDGATDKLNSQPSYHGYFASLSVLIPCLLVLLLWVIGGQSLVESLVIAGLPADLASADRDQIGLLLDRIRLVVDNGRGIEADPVVIEAAARFDALYRQGMWATLSLLLAVGTAGGYIASIRSKPAFAARTMVERILNFGLALSSFIAILVTLGIVFSLIFESVRFFQLVPVQDFLFGLKWSPQTALRADQVAAEGTFGVVPLFAGTFLVSLLAMLVAGPIGLFAAIYLTQYAGRRTRQVAKPLLEILAGIPTVVYGFFAALTVAPLFHNIGLSLGLDVASESALAAGVVMGIMIIPFVSSLSDDAITAVPQPLQDGSLALGATRAETIVRVVLPAALPGVTGAFLLAVSRVIGETMIVVMAAGMRPNLTANPFEAVTTVTVQIVALLTGDQEFDSPKTLSAFALGLVLFVLTLALNIFALRMVRKYREAYD